VTVVPGLGTGAYVFRCNKARNVSSTCTTSSSRRFAETPLADHSARTEANGEIRISASGGLTQPTPAPSCAIRSGHTTSTAAHWRKTLIG